MDTTKQDLLEALRAEANRPEALAVRAAADARAEDELAVEAEAYEVATWNPRHAIEGWAGGYGTNGDVRAQAVMERALEIQAGWRSGVR